MTAIAERVIVYFDLSAAGQGEWFTLDDPVKGELDGTYTLPGDVATDITESVYAFSVRRGRDRETDNILPGTASVRLRNQDGRFLPDEFFETPPGLSLTDEDGDEIVDEDDNELLGASMSPYGTGNITPGKRITILSASKPIFDGVIEDWNFDYTRDGSATAEIVAWDALGQLANMELDAHTATASELPGVRLASALDRPEIDYGYNRDLDDGYTPLQADTVDQGENLLAYQQLIARTDAGRLFASRSGTLTFRDRNAYATPETKATFGDDAIDHSQLRLVFGSEVLYSRVSVTRDGGTTQTATNAGIHGNRSLKITNTLHSTDEQALDLAQWFASIYSTPQPRYSPITVGLHGLSAADQAIVAALDIADTIAVSWSPPGALAVVSQTLVVEGVSHESPGYGEHWTTISCTPVALAAPFILDDPVLGLLGSGVLAY